MGVLILHKCRSLSAGAAFVWPVFFTTLISLILGVTFDTRISHVPEGDVLVNCRIP